MEDIAFPAWVVNTPAMAVAVSLSRHLFQEAELDVSRRTEEADKLERVQRGMVDADAVHREAAEQNDLSSAQSDTGEGPEVADRGDAASISSDASDASHEDAAGRARFLFGSHAPGEHRYARLLAQTHRGASASRPPASPTSAAPWSPDKGRPDLLQDSRVQLLFRLSSFNDIATGVAADVSANSAAALVALLGCAVDCTALPGDFSRGFYMECSSLYASLLSRLPTLHYSPNMDVQGFVASVVACGMKLRATLEASGDGTGSVAYAADGALHTSSGRSTPRANGVACHGQSLTLSGFSARMVDPALVACIPESIDACVRNPIALGALEGLAYTHSRAAVCFAPALVAHLNNLTDAFALSEQRRELAYKTLLSLLLEAMSCSKVIDHERTNNWVTAIIQEDYVVRGLFQREILHARVVAATLTLLIRQYQELAHECAEQAAGADGVPDFTEGDQLIELVWRALREGLSAWEGTPNSSLTLYGANVRVVLENLLLVEAERVRCYLVITSATNAYQQRMLADNSLLSIPSTAVLAGQAVRPAQSGSGATAADDNRASLPVYVPSVQEERLRVRIAENVVKFLLMPTSVVNLPNAGSGNNTAVTTLQRSLTGLCARLLRVTCADRVSLGAPGQAVPAAAAAMFADGAVAPTDDKAARSRHEYCEDTAPVRFSNRYYNQVEQVVRTLITTVMQGDSAASEARGANASSSARHSQAKGQVEAATVCLQGFCASDAHIGSFVVSEVTDAIQSMLRDITAHAEMPSEEVAARLSLCVETLRSVLVPQAGIHGSRVDPTALRRYCQLLSDTYENLLRLEVVENKKIKDGMHEGKVGDLLPTLNMRVVTDAFWRLTVSVHERLLGLSSDALQVTRDRALKARYLRQINEESEAIRVLLSESIQCVLRVAWPGSGVLYQQAGKGGVKVPGTPSAQPARLAPFALVVISPFFRVIGLLLHLAALFPLQRLSTLAAHVETGPALLRDDRVETAVLAYFFRPSKLHSSFHTQLSMSQFRTFWLLLAHYGFTTEALALSSHDMRRTLATQHTRTVAQTVGTPRHHY